MASMSDKSPAFASTAANPKDRANPKDKGLRDAAQVSASSASDGVVRELEQLRDRFRKTTNALASAAHDLKTPLAILNGYIELLQSQKLGPLNDRQREVMGDMFSSGQRLQQFI
jgi:signal transduction histidine kinase